MPGRPPSAAQAPLASFLQASRSGGIGAKRGPPTFNPAMVSPQNQLNVLAGLTRCSATFQRQATQVAVTVLKVRQRRELGIPAAPGNQSAPHTCARTEPSGTRPEVGRGALSQADGSLSMGPGAEARRVDAGAPEWQVRRSHQSLRSRVPTHQSPADPASGTPRQRQVSHTGSAASPRRTCSFPKGSPKSASLGAGHMAWVLKESRSSDALEGTEGDQVSIQSPGQGNSLFIYCLFVCLFVFNDYEKEKSYKALGEMLNIKPTNKIF